MNATLIILLVYSGLDLRLTAGFKSCFTAKKEEQARNYLITYMQREVKLLSIYEMRYYNEVLSHNPTEEVVHYSERYVKNSYDGFADNINMGDKVKYPVSPDDLKYHYMFFQSVGLDPTNRLWAGPFYGALATYLSFLATIELRICALYYNKINSEVNYEDKEYTRRQRMADELTQYMYWYAFILYEQKLYDLSHHAVENRKPDIKVVLDKLRVNTKDVINAIRAVDLGFIMDLERLNDHKHPFRTRGPLYCTVEFKDKLELYFRKPKKFISKAGLKMGENHYLAKPDSEIKTTITIFPTSSSWFLPKHGKDKQSARKNFRTGMWKLILEFLWDEISTIDTYFATCMSALVNPQVLPRKQRTRKHFLWKIDGYEVIWEKLDALMEIKNTTPFSEEYNEGEKYRNNPVRILRAMRSFQLGESSAEVEKNTPYYKGL